MQRHLVLALALALVLLAGCNPVSDILDMVEMADAVESELAERHGLKCEIGVNKVNGQLSTITVVIDHREVTDLPIADIVALVQPSVKRHFGEMPNSLVISVAIPK